MKLTELVHNVFLAASLREKILVRMPERIAKFSGRDCVLMNNNANLLLNVSGEDQDNNAIGFHGFVKSLRKCISGHHSSFTGEFTEGREETSFLSALLNAVTMIM